MYIFENAVYKSQFHLLCHRSWNVDEIGVQSPDRFRKNDRVTIFELPRFTVPLIADIMVAASVTNLQPFEVQCRDWRNRLRNRHLKGVVRVSETPFPVSHTSKENQREFSVVRNTTRTLRCSPRHLTLMYIRLLPSCERNIGFEVIMDLPTV